MFAKSTLFFALFATLSQLVASATPPACFIAAINTQPNAADLDTICGSKSSDVQDQIRKLCGGDTDAALSAFSDNCNTFGKTITISSSTSSGSTLSTSSGSSSSGTSTSTASGTSSGSTSASKAGSTSGSATATSSGSSSASGFSTETSGSVVSTYPTSNSTSPSATIGSGSGSGSASPSGSSSSPSQATSTGGASTQNGAPFEFWKVVGLGALIVFGMMAAL